MTESKFPSEVIDLPSSGWYYAKESPLASGQIEISYMTARHEDILTSTNLIKKGIVIERLLQELIVNKDISYGDLLIGDKNAIMIASRVLGYGKDYSVKIVCPDCGEKNTMDVDLTLLNDKDITEPIKKNVNEFEYTLPASKRILKYHLLTQANEDSIDKEVESHRKVDSNVDKTLTTRLKYIITSIDGDESPAAIRKFVDNDFLARDSIAFRKEYQTVSPDIDFVMTHKCIHCDEEREMRVPIGPDFFWPDSTV